MASWIDVFSLLMTTLFVVGTILGILYVIHQVSLHTAAIKESLKNKGINISREGVSVKTETYFDRNDYVDATQRGFVKALNAATCGPESNKHTFLPPSNGSRSGNNHIYESFATALRKTHSGEREEKHSN